MAYGILLLYRYPGVPFCMNISRLFHTLKGYFYHGHFSLIFNLLRNHAKMGIQFVTKEQIRQS